MAEQAIDPPPGVKIEELDWFAVEVKPGTFHDDPAETPVQPGRYIVGFLPGNGPWSGEPDVVVRAEQATNEDGLPVEEWAAQQIAARLARPEQEVPTGSIPGLLRKLGVR